MFGYCLIMFLEWIIQSLHIVFFLGCHKKQYPLVWNPRFPTDLVEGIQSFCFGKKHPVYLTGYILD